MIRQVAGAFAFYLRKKVKERIVVIESDDWGLERARHAKALVWMAEKYGKKNFSRWSTDALETPDDLQALFNLLENYKNKFEKPPVFTTNFITHNVDRDGSGQLTFRPLSDTTREMRAIYLKGINDRYIFPQFHGFSHFNTSSVMDYVKLDEAKEAQDNGFLLAKTTVRGSLSFLHGEFSGENLYAEREFEIGMREFNQFFGITSCSIIPPTFVFDTKYFSLLKRHNIGYLQAGNRLKSAANKRYFFPLLRKKNGIVWGVRNARLDPHPDYGFGYEQCLNSISRAFEHQLPAVIDLHRVNISGRYQGSYRGDTLWHLDHLLDAIFKKWPDTQFLTTEELMNKVNGTSQSN